jgi:hypothetical protein
MSTDQTPALARADVLPLRLDLIETLGRWVNDACATEAVDEGLLPLLRRRLHDPDDPDALARLLFDASQQWVEADGVTTRLDWSNLHRSQQEQWRRAADAVRSAILGADQ